MATQQKVDISLSSEKEERTREALKRLLHTYTLDKWMYCDDVVIVYGGRGKAFPRITLSAWQDADDGLLAQFLHEQIHWIEKGNEGNMREAIAELKVVFPNAPTERPEGGGNEESTYKHLIICRLEFLALAELLGSQKAQEIVSTNDNYTWIRETIFKEEQQIDALIKKYFPTVL